MKQGIRIKHYGWGFVYALLLLWRSRGQGQHQCAQLGFDDLQLLLLHPGA